MTPILFNFIVTHCTEKHGNFFTHEQKPWGEICGDYFEPKETILQIVNLRNGPAEPFLDFAATHSCPISYRITGIVLTLVSGRKKTYSEGEQR